MFARTIISGDTFLDMTLSAQALYFHLSMYADDDGFVDNPKSIQRMIGAKNTDFQQLVDNAFILPFESGVVVIRHWKVHNTLQKDRYHETVHQQEKALLGVNESKAYFHRISECFQDGNRMEPENSIDIEKESIDKGSSSISQLVLAAATAANLILNDHNRKCLFELETEYGQDNLLKAINRAVENSSATENKVTIAYIRETLKGMRHDYQILQDAYTKRRTATGLENWD